VDLIRSAGHFADGAHRRMRHHDVARLDAEASKCICQFRA
jgi:hypothetical protein